MLVFAPALVAASSTTSFAAPAAPASSVATPFVGQEVTLTGIIGTPGVRSVELQKLTSSWKKYASGKTLADGTYSFKASTTAPSRQFRVFAKAEGGNTALTSDPITLTTQKDAVSLNIARVGNSFKASGVASPKIDGRLFAL